MMIASKIKHQQTIHKTLGRLLSSATCFGSCMCDLLPPTGERLAAKRANMEL